MVRTCFFCRLNNQYICDEEHCGGCPAGQEPLSEDQKPSERMYDGRAWIPGDVSAEEEDGKPSKNTKPSERMMENVDDTQK